MMLNKQTLISLPPPLSPSLPLSAFLPPLGSEIDGWRDGGRERERENQVELSGTGTCYVLDIEVELEHAGAN